ncbi:MAG: 2,3-epoxybenzoyl-CoA dihydrolase [Acidimicrobiales bacterium]
MDDPTIRFDTAPDRYRHWRLDIAPPRATLTLAVDPGAGLRDDYELKTNSYDLGVDIELYDAVQRLRFEHPEVTVVVITGGVDKVFCSGANIQMLAGATHRHKVNFCKFTNETRNSIEDATEHSGQVWLAAVNGTAAGGGYELALACDEILLVDDRASTVSLPEIPLLAVLPGTGGLTRVVDKRHVRRDLADAFTTRGEGVRAETALAWGLVDATAPRSGFDALVDERVRARAAGSHRPGHGPGVELTPIGGTWTGDGIALRFVTVEIDRSIGAATITLRGPAGDQPSTGDELVTAGADGWLLSAARQLDAVLLHLRFNETAVGTWVIRTEGDLDATTRAEAVLAAEPDHWLVREITRYWARTLKRLDLSARSVFTLIEPGSTMAGPLAELVLAADRSFMLEGTWADRADPPPPARLRLTGGNLGAYPMANGLSRLATRFWGRPAALAAAEQAVGKDLLAADALEAGLVTFTPDDLDWDDEVRLAVEERNSFSPDALTGMEASYRFVGPETTETKIFARLSAWQNWIFQRPNAVGAYGALRRFGTGSRPDFDHRRV